jgi:hypothetical protein
MTARLVFLVGLLLLQTPRYYPETIDSLATSTHAAVQVGGTVTAVTVTQAGQITFRLRDAHGHTVGCVLGPTLRDQPRVGVELIVSGQRQRYAPADRPPVVEIDPVEQMEPVER